MLNGFNRAGTDPDWHPYKKTLGDTHTRKEDHVKTQSEGGSLQAEERSLRRDRSWPPPDLRLPASRTVRNAFLLLKPPSL